MGSPVNETTGRRHELSFRAGTAVRGHFGIEWDLTEASASETHDLAEWIAFHKAHRELLHSGDVIRSDDSDDTLSIHGVVSADRSEALVFLAYLSRSDASPRGRFTLPGLDPDRRYRIAPVVVGTPDTRLAPPSWYHDGTGTVLSGRALAVTGLRIPGARPERVVVLRVYEEVG